MIATKYNIAEIGTFSWLRDAVIFLYSNDAKEMMAKPTTRLRPVKDKQ